MVKNLPAVLKTCVQSLGWEDSPEKGMANYSNITAWRIPWTEEPAEYSPWSCKELDTIERLTLLLSKFQNQKIWIFFKQINQSEQLFEYFSSCFCRLCPLHLWFGGQNSVLISLCMILELYVSASCYL